jgi:transposase
MSDTFSKVEVISGVARRRRFSTDLKLAVVAETMQPGMSISYVARRHGLSPSLVFRWRRLISEGAAKPSAPMTRLCLPPSCAGWKSGCATSNGCWARRPWRTRSCGEALDLAQLKKRLLRLSSPARDGTL